jgi:spoIIIJ-associated protein
MEWVETTGRTLEEAKDAALDRLGVDERDAEFEVLSEAKSGLFGRLRSEARVRARVRPSAPPPKVDRRDRRRRPGSGRTNDEAPRPSTSPSPTPSNGGGSASGQRRGQGRSRKPAATTATLEQGENVSDTTTPAEAAASLHSFLEGLLDVFELEGEVEVVELDEEVVEGRIDGDDLGILIGPKGQTLAAVQELARSAISHGPGTRLRVDVAGYRERRREALERFATTVAEQVLSSGTPTALEPMPAADRKVVHDTINAIEGIHTVSDGEEPRRRVVVHPD